LVQVLEANTKTFDGSVYVDLLKKAVHSHPTSTPLFELLVRRLESLNRIDEANEAIIALEDAWVDRFGNVDIPRLSLYSSNSNASATFPKRSPYAFLAASLACIASMCLLAVAATHMARSSFSPKRYAPGIRILSRRKGAGGRNALTITEFSVVDGGLANVETLSDGGVVLTTARKDSTQRDILEPDGTFTPCAEGLVDRLGEVAVYQTDSKKVRWIRGKTSVTLSASTPELPVFEAGPILSDKEFLAARVCDDSYRDHLQTLVCGAWGCRPITPPGPSPQTEQATFVDKRSVYVKYSLGRSEGWRYRAARYGLADGKLSGIANADIIYRTSLGVLVCKPQTVSVKNGDYDSHWDGRVVLLRENATPREVWVGGASHFEHVDCFSDCLVVQTSHTAVERRLPASRSQVR
jgi:hypothetical protein